MVFHFRQTPNDADEQRFIVRAQLLAQNVAARFVILKRRQIQAERNHGELFGAAHTELLVNFFELLRTNNHDFVGGKTR